VAGRLRAEGVDRRRRGKDRRAREESGELRRPGGKKGPALTDLRKNKQWTPAKITDQIMNGGQKMPAFRESVSDEEAAQLVAWLRAKHRPVAPDTAAAK
jgi:mono/diheme cytochrome c family protein